MDARILRADAVLEVVLAAACVTIAVLVPAERLPGWFGPPVLLVLTAVLLIAAAALGWLARSPTPATLRAVALGNAATAAVTLAFALAGPGADSGLRIGLGGCALIIGALAGTQWLVARATARPVHHDSSGTGIVGGAER